MVQGEISNHQKSEGDVYDRPKNLTLGSEHGRIDSYIESVSSILTSCRRQWTGKSPCTMTSNARDKTTVNRVRDGTIDDGLTVLV